MPSIRPRRLVLAALCCGSLASVGLAAGDAPPDVADAVQLLADVTLIDGECRNVAVNFGQAFQAALAMGLRASEVMPTGGRRPAFEAAMRSRFAATPHEDLCESLAKGYAARVPGVIRFR